MEEKEPGSDRVFVHTAICNLPYDKFLFFLFLFFSLSLPPSHLLTLSLTHSFARCWEFLRKFYHFIFLCAWNVIFVSNLRILKVATQRISFLPFFFSSQTHTHTRMGKKKFDGYLNTFVDFMRTSSHWKGIRQKRNIVIYGAINFYACFVTFICHLRLHTESGGDAHQRTIFFQFCEKKG